VPLRLGQVREEIAGRIWIERTPLPGTLACEAK
jgi:hypothetical protein